MCFVVACFTTLLATTALGLPAVLDSGVNAANGHVYYLLEASDWTDAEAAPMDWAATWPQLEVWPRTIGIGIVGGRIGIFGLDITIRIIMTAEAHNMRRISSGHQVRPQPIQIGTPVNQMGISIPTCSRWV